MATGQFYVVAKDDLTPGQAVGRVALFNEDGTPWSPGGDGPVSVAWGDVTDKPSSYVPDMQLSVVTPDPSVGLEEGGLQVTLQSLAGRIAALEG